MTAGSSIPRAALLLASVAILASCKSGDTTSEDAQLSEGGEGDDGWEDWDDEEPLVESHHGAIEALGISGPDAPWSEMSHVDREWYMVGKVLPIMKELFAGHDEERWGQEYGCATCHGDDMAEREYAMPPTASYRVPARGSAAWTAMEGIFGETVTFMEETVTPTMGTLLGVEDYTCFHCHPRAE